jgi:hypothetical protein
MEISEQKQKKLRKKFRKRPGRSPQVRLQSPLGGFKPERGE